MADKVINWTRPMLARFKKEYERAVKFKVEQFTFEDNEFVVSYAKYLIEYLEGKLHER